MRVSLTFTPFDKVDCAHCGAKEAAGATFTVVTEEHSGDVEALCLSCLAGAGDCDQGLSVDVPMKLLVEKTNHRRKALKRNRRVSYKQEVELAQELGGRVQPASGAMPGAKGDVRKKGEIRLEAKWTAAKTFSLPVEELEKIASEVGALEKPVYVIDYLEKTGRLRGRYAVVPWDDYKEMRNALGKHR